MEGDGEREREREGGGGRESILKHLEGFGAKVTYIHTYLSHRH